VVPIPTNDRPRRIALSAIAVLAALAAATALVAALETVFRLDNASAVYLLAVVAIAILLGTASAIATAVGAFLAYNFAFVEPRYTFVVGRADEVLTLFLLLFVGIVSGRLAGRQRDREQKASRREREARAIFGISRELATSERLTDAMQSVVARLADETGMERTWVGLGATVIHERVVADSGGVSTPRPTVGTFAVLQRDREEGAATWTRIRAPAAVGTRHAEAQGMTRRAGLFRVELRSAGETVGSLWSQRADSAGQPQLEETRLLAAAADQLGQAVRRERLQAQTAELEIARRSDELKSALVDSVSHELRTPLATIRATAGSLADPAIELSDADRRAAAGAIDAEAHRLNRLVGELLDMSRIQGGALVADIEVIPLDELVRPAVERARAGAEHRQIDLELPPDLPSVRADAALLDQVISNLLENAIRHAGPDASIRVRGDADPDATVSLVVEDAGAGVLDEDLPRLFDRFYRVARVTDGRRRGFGLGLSVVKGLVEAMGGTVTAARSSKGGLAVTVVLPAEPAGRGDS
jgi:two-component system sensor histidine kinase KdpD